ncbi:MAG TPA: hypothetical protein VN281_17610 [Verrucomicrobiae bacterium]|nr:hypothetical protein [Verrucomicrobiae bacterium]
MTNIKNKTPGSEPGVPVNFSLCGCELNFSSLSTLLLLVPKVDRKEAASTKQ